MNKKKSDLKTELLDLLGSLQKKLDTANKNLEEIIKNVKEFNNEFQLNEDLWIVINADNLNSPLLSKTLSRLVKGY